MSNDGGDDAMEMTLIMLVISIGVVVAIITSRRRRNQEYMRLVKDFKAWMEPYQRRLSDVNRFILNEEVLRFAFSEYPTELVHRLWEDLVKDAYTDIDPMDGERCLRRR